MGRIGHAFSQVAARLSMPRLSGPLQIDLFLEAGSVAEEGERRWFRESACERSRLQVRNWPHEILEMVIQNQYLIMEV